MSRLYPGTTCACLFRDSLRARLAVPCEAHMRRALRSMFPTLAAPDDRGPQSVEFTESPRGYAAHERWARRYDDLDGAPENEGDR